MALYWDAFRQCFFLPAPTFSEANLSDQTGRVFIVTGGYAGVGKELVRILYQAGGTVYVAGRSQAKYDAALAEIKSESPSADGRLEFLLLDLADLQSVKQAAATFLKLEQRLDVLTNNAGVMTPPKGFVTAQGCELQMGTNCLGPQLFTTLLTPLLAKTAASSPPGSVRVTWAASLATIASPTGGIDWDPKAGHPMIFDDPFKNYAQSKGTNVLLAQEFARRNGTTGIVSNAWNPGNLLSELQRHQNAFEYIFSKLLSYPSKLGGYTALFAGWSPETGAVENAGRYIGPWGRFVALRPDVKKSDEGARFWDWCDGETKEYR